MKDYLKNLFTSADNETFSLSKLIAFAAGIVMIGNYARFGGDVQAFGIAIGAIITSLAIKTATDK